MKNLFEGGSMFELTAADQKRLDALVRQAGVSNERNDHEVIGQALAEPIRQVADYASWTNMFFMHQNVGPTEDNRIPVDSYLTVAFYTSPTGQIMYTRPGRAYTRPDFTAISVGIEIGWDTQAEAGWNVLGRKQLEAAEELARKQDSLAKTVLDASVTTSGNTTATAAGGVLTKAAVDAALAAMAARGFPARIIAVNNADAMDMTNWTLANSLLRWTPEQVTALTTKLYWATYGGADWFVSPWVPASTVYMSAGPEKTGYHQMKGGIQTASDINITKRIDLHTWYKKSAYYVGNDYAVHTITVTA